MMILMIIDWGDTISFKKYMMILMIIDWDDQL